MELHMCKSDWSDLVKHLLPDESDVEQAAFIFASQTRGNLVVTDWRAIDTSGFERQLPWYLELDHETQARLIKRAHDLDACLVECHSHPSPSPAAFSPSDLVGLREFVPHVRWRLEGRPYVAVVVAPSGFDALVWEGTEDRPVVLDGIMLGTERLEPTGLTVARLEDNDGYEV